MGQPKSFTAMGSLFFRDDEGNLYMPIMGATLTGQLDGLLEKVELDYPSDTDWSGRFTERELRLIANCEAYTKGDPAGLPGHNLMIVVAKLSQLLDDMTSVINRAKTGPGSEEGRVWGEA